MKTIDDWGKYILNKTQEITNILAEKFKGFNTLNISLDNENIKKEEKNEEKPIQSFIICHGCNIKTIVGKIYKCKTCNNFYFCEKCYEKIKKLLGINLEISQLKLTVIVELIIFQVINQMKMN